MNNTGISRYIQLWCCCGIVYFIHLDSGYKSAVQNDVQLKVVTTNTIVAM